MPHLLWLMFGILALAAVATYIVPAGQFATDADGNILADQFAFLPEQTPVGPGATLMLVLDGLVAAAPIVFVVMMSGAGIAIVLEAKAFDNILNYAIYKLKDKGTIIIISVMFCLMVYIGGFSGSDALIAMVPVGVLFAKKLNLDAVSAMGVTTFATLIGFGTGPNNPLIPQLLIGLPPYSGFGLRFASMNLFMVLGLIMLLRYVAKIQKSPEKSLMYKEGWRPEAVAVSAEDEEGTLHEEKLRWQSLAIIAVFVGQFLVIIWYSTTGGENTLNFMIAVNLIAAVVNGLIARFDANKLANTIAKGLTDMAFVGFVIGLARVMSLILVEGNILDSIVFYLTRPLAGVPLSVSTVVMLLIFASINFLIPSATSKAAILIPIVAPITTAIGLHPQLAIQAFQFGDGFTNLLSPVLAWLLGSCVMAGISYATWVKWVFPKVLLFLVVGCLIMVGLTAVGWTGGV